MGELGRQSQCFLGKSAITLQITILNSPYSIDCAIAYNLIMDFEWDKSKAAANLSKHSVSFEEAKTIFNDPLYVDFYDPDHSDNEDRYLIVGRSNQDRLLIASYTERDNSIRLISARVVTRSEREAYEK